ncbi:MAG: hypothetical protein EA398_17995 [Deltaproteobacteria bacterium]|nr:MAG: hypothetical protein EA398_17995 [Deltaproteobacteria bacterium]
MTTHRFLSLALLMLGLVLSGCGSDDQPSPTSTSGDGTQPSTAVEPSVPSTDDVGGTSTDASDDVSDPILTDPFPGEATRTALREDDERALDEPFDPALRVGYGHRDLAWRAGAKPGQIGTAALPARDALLARAVGEILPVLTRRDRQRVVQEVSAWILERMEQTNADLEHGRYSILFEPGRGVEQPPAVNAFVISQGDTHVAIVSADLYLPHEQLHRRVAHLVSDRTGIQRDRLFLAATHNHSAPHAVSPAFGIWTFGDQFDARHWSYMTHEIADAIVEAWEARVPATVRTGRTSFTRVQRNIIGASVAEVRPTPDADRELVDVGYPPEYFEDDLVVLRFDHADESGPLGQIFVLGMHPETLRDNHGITSGEFPRHAERKIAARTGAPALWLSGALGDVEPDRERVTPGADYWRRGFAAMDRMTDEIADAVVALHDSLGSSPAEPDPVLLNLARDLPGPEDFAIPDSSYLGPRLPMLRLIHDSMRIRMHLVRIHDVLLVGTPGEMPTDQSLNLKSRLETGADSNLVFQGYVFPDAPQWVVERIERNFSTSVAPPEAQVPIVAAISLVNTYMGYIVTAWEYENREHYRESLTGFGAGTADHVNTLALELAVEMHGGSRADRAFDPLIEDDLAGFDALTLWLRGRDAQVAAFSRAIPASDPTGVAVPLGEPAFLDADPEDEDGFPERVEFSFRGGTNDVDLPQLRIERWSDDDDAWLTHAEGPSLELFLLFEGPDQWTASWRAPIAGATVRVVADGVYRGEQDNATAPHPLWDPDGRNVAYTFVSEPFVVPGTDPAPTEPAPTEPSSSAPSEPEPAPTEPSPSAPSEPGPEPSSATPG